MSAGEWCLIESDPGVFTELIRNFGVSGVQIEELYMLDFKQLQDFKLVQKIFGYECKRQLLFAYRPIYGLIFLFKYRPGEESSGQFTESSDIYFAQQVINNACATQAIINLLFNLDNNEVTLGEMLENFRSFSKDMDPAVRFFVCLLLFFFLLRICLLERRKLTPVGVRLT